GHRNLRTEEWFSMALANYRSLLIGSFIAVTALAVYVPHSATSAQDAKPEGGKLVYADFEQMENGRPVSKGGGMVQLFGGQETTPVHFKGLANASPGAPEIVVSKSDEKNHIATFEYN